MLHHHGRETISRKGWRDSGKLRLPGTEKTPNAGFFSAACRRHCVRASTPQRSMEELLRKADSLCVRTISTITEVPAELASAVITGDRPAVNAIFKKYTGKSGTGKMQNKGQVCWYHDTFSDDSLCYSGPPALPAARSSLSQRTPCPARGTFERAVSHRYIVWLASSRPVTW